MITAYNRAKCIGKLNQLLHQPWQHLDNMFPMLDEWPLWAIKHKQNVNKAPVEARKLIEKCFELRIFFTLCMFKMKDLLTLSNL